MSDWKNVQYKDGKMRTSEGGGGGGSSTFAGLDDVNFLDIQNGQVPKYNSETHKWENADESGGGSSSADDVTYDNTTSEKTKYYIPALSFPTLCVMSQIWTGASYISVSPDIGLNRRVSSTDTCRLMAFINQNISNTITVQNDAIDYTSDANGNRVFRYKII